LRTRSFVIIVALHIAFLLGGFRNNKETAREGIHLQKKIGGFGPLFSLLIVVVLFIRGCVHAPLADAVAIAEGKNCATGAAHVQLFPGFVTVVWAATHFVTAAGVVFTHCHRSFSFYSDMEVPFQEYFGN
jgi:hypothetical protein